MANQRGQQHQFESIADQGTILRDSDRLQQVFLNLANNACEASPEGGRIHWRLSRDITDQTPVLSILNPGKPISEQVLERLFDPFFTTKSSGTGLGLGIVKRIVDAHGGEISVRPIPGEGTEVLPQIPHA